MHLKSAVVTTFIRQMFVMLIGLASISLVSRALGPSEFGRYALVVAASNLGQTIFSFSIPAVIIHFYSRFSDKSRSIGSLLLVVCLLVAAAAMLVFLGYFFGLLDRWEIDGVGASLLFVLMLGQIVNSVLEAVFLGERRYKIFNAMQAVVPITSLVGFWIFLNGGSGWHVAVSVMCVSVMVATPLYLYLSMKIVGGCVLRFDAETTKKVFSYGFQMWSANLITMALYRTPIFVVESFCSKGDLGVFALANNFSEKVWVPGKAVATILFPERSNSISGGVNSSGVYRFVLGNMIVAFSGMALLCFIFFMFSRAFFGSGYEALYEVSLCLMPGIVAWSGVTILGAELAGLGLSKQNFNVSFLAFLITVIGTVCLSQYGLLAVAAGASAGYCAGLVLSVFAYRKAQIAIVS